MRTRRRAYAIGVLALFTLAQPGLAHAQTPSEIALAKQWFAEGSSLEDQGSWGEALAHFRRASQVKMTAQVAFHIGLCEGRSGALVEALVSLARAAELAHAANLTTVENAAKAEAAEVKTRVPTLEISAKPSDKLARISIDGQQVALAMIDAPFPINPGDHEIVAEFASGTVRKAIKLKLKEVARLPLEAPPESAPDPVPVGAAPPTVTTVTSAPPSPPPANKTTARSSSTVPWILILGGGAAAVGGVVFFVLTQNEIAFLDGQCGPGRTCSSSRADLHDGVSRGKTYSALSTALFAVGVVAIASGGGLLLFGHKNEGANARLLPMGSPTSGGAALSGRF